MYPNFSPFFRENHGKHATIILAIICNCGPCKNFLCISIFKYIKLRLSPFKNPLHLAINCKRLYSM